MRGHRTLEARPLRSLERRRRSSSQAGITSLVGPNGAGKTNLLEALYFALTGRSFRTARPPRADPLRHPPRPRRGGVRDQDGAEHCLLASVSRREGRRHLLDGCAADPTARRATARLSRSSRPTGWRWSRARPRERRAHLDRFIAARWPSRAELRRRFGQALAQRNALVARVAAGRNRAADLDPWDATVARPRRR